MKFVKTPIEGLLSIEPAVFSDSRGSFFESFSAREFVQHAADFTFVQDNQSHSSKNVLRGLHFQRPPYEQGKLVRVVKGAVWDVAVDIRPGSETFGKFFAEELSETNRRMFWIPPGFAHGFLTLADDTIFIYKCTGYYNKESESGIRFDDPALRIPWNVSDPLVSDKDKQLPYLHEIKF